MGTLSLCVCLYVPEDSLYLQQLVFRDPNNVTDVHLTSMNWPVFDAKDAFYLDMGRHLIEKHGLYLNRYARWNVTRNEV